MRHRVGLRMYLATAFAVIAVAAGSAFGYLAGQAIGIGMEHRIVDALLRVAYATGHAIDDEVLDHAHDISVVTVLLGMARDAGLDDDAPIGVETLRASKACAWAAVLDVSGKVSAASQGAPDAIGAVSDEEWFGRALKGPVVVDRAESSAHGLVPPVMLAEPSRDRDGRPIGVVACSLGANWIAEVASRFLGNVPSGNPTELFVLDSAGRIVLAPAAGGEARLPSELAAVTGKPAYIRTDLRWPDGKEYVTAVTTLGMLPLSGLDWRIVIRRDAESALAPIAEMHRQVLGFGVGLALVAGLAGALAAHRILIPLRRIAEVARRIGGGEFGLHIPDVRTYREVETLSASLRTMLASLRANEARLAALNESLDQRVRQRTAEIAEAHEALARQESRLRAVIETAMDGVLIIDEQGRIEIFNAACERIFGWKAHEIIGRAAGELLADESRSLRGAQLAFENLLDPLAAGGVASSQVQTLRGQRRDGGTFPLEISLSRTTVKGGPVYVAIVRDITETVRAREQLFALATQDSLTGLRNRRYFLEAAETEFARARRHGRGFALLLIDADHFKRVNDTHGHAAGDAALRGLAEVFNRSLREVDVVGRLGGEEFAVAMPETELARARQVAERLRQQIAEHEVASDGETLRITVSIGIASSAGDATLDQTLRRADQALYAAKGAGRNRVEVAAPGGQAAGA